MPAVRFSRDKRGYEYVYLIHTPIRRGKPGRSQVLYWYRTPPGVRVGRKPFDEEVQRILESQNPGVVFDWDAIISTPMPPPDMTEYWRERRKAAKAARQERREEELLEAADGATDEAAEAVPGAGEDAANPTADVAPGASDPSAPADDVAGAVKRRRRRGGRRRRQGGTSEGQGGTGTSDAPAAHDVEAGDDSTSRTDSTSEGE